MRKEASTKRSVPVPAAISREDLEIAFPWVRYLPPEAIRELLARVASYRAAARIYSRKPSAWLVDPTIEPPVTCYNTTANGPTRATQRYRQSVHEEYFAQPPTRNRLNARSSKAGDHYVRSLPRAVARCSRGTVRGTSRRIIPAR